MKSRLFIAANTLLAFTLKTNVVYAYANAESSNEGVSFFSSLMKFIGFLIIFGAVIFLAYYTTRLIANRSNQSMKGGNMEVLDFMSLGTTAKIMMVKIERYVYVIAVSGGNITSIDRLEYEDLDLEEKSPYAGDFDEQLRKLINSEKLSELKGKFSKKRDGR
jgi:flagellar protein FliO/FliZ